MRTAPLLCLCFVFVAAAANECGEDTGCAAEEDASALLQSVLSFGSAQLADGDETTGCSGDTETLCDTSACSWAGEECKPKCSSINSKTNCVGSGYCAWRGMSARYGNCIEEVGSIDLGGEDSGMKYQNSAPVAQRPELLLRDHYDGSTWAPCSGSTDCWYGYEPSGNWRNDDLRVTLSANSAYSKAGVDFLVKCQTGTGSHIKVTYADVERKNAEVQVWYDHIAKIRNVAGNSDWATQERRRRRRKRRKEENEIRHLEIPISSTDANPLFRMVVSRDKAKFDTSLEAKIEVKDVKAWFDSCMEKKQAHSQCLQIFADGNEALRSDNAKQLACLEGTSTSSGCTAWKSCLDSTSGGAETKTTLKNVIKAFDQGAVQLVQQDTMTPSSWSASNNECTDGQHPVCEDLSRLDVPAFSCTCYNDLQNADGTTKTPQQIQALACPKRAMCCSWKRSNCNDASTYTLTGSTALLQVADEEDSEKTMSNRSEQASLAQGASLDESLSGKRC